MEEVLSVFIISGVTSSLFSSLLPAISGKYNIFATTRPETSQQRIDVLRESGVKFISVQDALGRDFDRCLWLSTHDDADLLAKFSVKYPTLAINSGAIMDIVMGKQDPATANAYQKAKLALYNVPQVYSFIPG